MCRIPRKEGITAGLITEEFRAIKEESAESQRSWVIGKIEKLQEHLALQIKAQSKQQLKDASISSLEKEIRYLEGMLVKSKISLAQAKSELDVSYLILTANQMYEFSNMTNRMKVESAEADDESKRSKSTVFRSTDYKSGKKSSLMSSFKHLFRKSEKANSPV